MRSSTVWVIAGLFWMSACGGRNEPRRDAGDRADAGIELDAGGGVPNIREALDCRFDTPPGAGGGELERHAIDLERFPDALCNDGTGAVIHFRPYRGIENQHRWVIALRGGGSCGSPEACAARYCGCSNARASECPAVEAESRTNFTADNMTGESPPRLPADGIFLRDGGAMRPNPIQDYNQVRVTYCSSDEWMGTRRAAPMSALHPVTGEPVDFSVHFLGARIFEATIATLRRDGVPTLHHTISDRDLPDLDEAVEVVFAGDSGGGAGVIHHLDRLRETLEDNNVACSASVCPLEVRGLIDAIVGPDMSRLDWSGTGVETYEAFRALIVSSRDSYYAPLYEGSCAAMHPGDEGYCSDLSHILRHHITTPFFVRMALADLLISDYYISANLADDELGPMTTEVFATLLSRELAALPGRPNAEEPDVEQAPGVFAPGCMKHDTIFDNEEVYFTTVREPDGSEPVLFDVFEPWRAGGPGVAVVADAPGESFCPNDP